MSLGWQIYTGTQRPHDGIRRLPDPPNWRRFTGEPVIDAPEHDDPNADRQLGVRTADRRPDPHDVQIVNAALYLRRPLLITGKPGTGKSSLAYSVARELKLGPVLHWPISSRSTVKQGLYLYDAIGRLHDENFEQLRVTPGERRPMITDIGRYLHVGPLGTALLPYRTPRVLLIDEIDKCDVDLPNDLLHVLENGRYTIDELARLPQNHPPVTVTTADEDNRTVNITGGSVQCAAFPFIVMTSNGERDFPPAFLRRVLRLELEPPSPEQLHAMVVAHLGPDAAANSKRIVDDFLRRRGGDDLSVDQLMNVLYLNVYRQHEPDAAWSAVVDALLRSLTGADGL